MERERMYMFLGLDDGVRLLGRLVRSKGIDTNVYIVNIFFLII